MDVSVVDQFRDHWDAISIEYLWQVFGGSFVSVQKIHVLHFVFRLENLQVFRSGDSLPMKKNSSLGEVLSFMSSEKDSFERQYIEYFKKEKRTCSILRRDKRLFWK